MNLKFLAALVLLSLLVGCSTTTPLRGRADLLDFLVDDKTTTSEALLKLGQPSARFQADKILTFRLGMEEKNRGYFVLTREMNPKGWPTWAKAKFSLVLVFDAQGLLRKHSLVEVN
jgi:hypothetical protein